jgi:plastocyanin
MRSLRLAAAAAALTLALAACGSSSSSPASSTPTQAAGGGGGSTSSSTPAPTGKTIAVTEKDFSISVAGASGIKPGTYTFAVTNNGPSSHNLTINGPGVANQATPTFASGTQNLTVTLQNGTYDLYCSVPGHKALGMDLKLTVGSGGGAAAGASSSSGGGSSSSGGGWS